MKLSLDKEKQAEEMMKSRKLNRHQQRFVHAVLANVDARDEKRRKANEIHS